MINGHIVDTLTQKNVTRHHTRTVFIKKKSLFNPLGSTQTVHETRATLDTVDRLVAWTVRRQHAATAFSGAVQLLLLAHTPVSRKVFQWFHCNDLSGKYFLRADYRIVCYSDIWYAFTPVVFVVLALFTVALPLSIIVYL